LAADSITPLGRLHCFEFDGGDTVQKENTFWQQVTTNLCSLTADGKKDSTHVSTVCPVVLLYEKFAFHQQI
jgi:hypothetical protein